MNFRSSQVISRVLFFHQPSDTTPESVKSVMLKTRAKPKRKAKTLLEVEVMVILCVWGNVAQPPWKRWVALYIVLSVATLARYSDIKRVPMRGIILIDGGGAEVCMPRRKNRQTGQVFWAALPPAGATALLRDLLSREREVAIHPQSGRCWLRRGASCCLS